MATLASIDEAIAKLDALIVALGGAAKLETAGGRTAAACNDHFTGSGMCA